MAEIPRVDEGIWHVDRDEDKVEDRVMASRDMLRSRCTAKEQESWLAQVHGVHPTGSPALPVGDLVRIPCFDQSFLVFLRRLRSSESLSLLP